jgi:MFS family permease
MTKKLNPTTAILWLALLLALVGSLRHVAWGFATLERGDAIAGYVQAIAVDIGLFAIALGIQQRRRQRRSTLVLWVGALGFAAISTYANLLHGLAWQTDIGLPEWRWLVALRPFLLSGVLPILVLYLTEIAGDDANYAMREAEKETRRLERERQPATQAGQPNASTANPASPPDTLALARDTRAALAEQATGNLLAFYASHPHATQTQAGAAVGRSRQWVSAQLAYLEQTGAIERNGDGVQVITR